MTLKFEKWLNKGKANNTVYFGLENEEKTYDWHYTAKIIKETLPA